MKPCFINAGSDEDAFEEYCDDFIDDVSYLSEKFDYRQKIGRKKSWQTLFKKFNVDDINFDELKPESTADSRIADLLTSLVVGSINDISKISIETSNQLLDRVKSKIVLFDTDQTSFVFQPSGGKKYVIQGLAGSGKTELLLHKMKEIYSRDIEAKIAFTCFNKILASSMTSRIPDFFDFMRVERQIDWNNKLFCFHAWGSNRDPYSGMYRYICHFYEIPFGSLQAGSFDYLCKKAINEINEISQDQKYAFDYVFIDESQDFAESFIELCSLTTKRKVFIAGDVFQNIFRPIDQGVNQANMVLKRCYRTDPKNLMFSHAVGMGLFETPVLRWLKPDEWEACGYTLEKQGNRAKISRAPLRRFEDIPADFEATKVYRLTQENTHSTAIIEIIKEIKKNHPTAQQGDIAVIFLDKEGYIYDAVNQLKVDAFESFGWIANVSFESKQSDPEKFFISNINNAKGLEFPFVICVAEQLKKTPTFRNALYTMMARSFLESHLLLGKNVSEDTLTSINKGLKFLSEHGYMDVRVPPPDEIENQVQWINVQEKPSINQLVREFCNQKNASARLRGKLMSRISDITSGEDYEEEEILEILKIEYKRNKTL